MSGAPHRSRSRPPFAPLGLGVVGCIAIAACTYDFDAFVSSGTGAGGDGGSPATGGAMATPSGGGSAASAGSPSEGGNGGEGGAPDGGGGDSSSSTGGAAPGGAAGDTGSGGAQPNGGTASGGVSSGGTSNAGSTSGGTTGTGGSGSGSFDCDAVSGTVWNGHCYFVTPKSDSWPNVRGACADYSPSTHLVAITDEAEEQMIETTFLMGNDLWIGLALADTSGNPPSSCRAMPSSCPFSWVTAEPLSYTKWGSHSATDREPNYSGGCVRIQVDDNTWADLGCSTSLPAICESD
jgi:hypothetical protein